MNSQPSSASMRSMVFDGGGAPATTTRTPPAPGTVSRPPRARPRRAARAPRHGRVEHGGDDGRRAVEERHALALHALQDLLAVDLADDHLARADGGHGVGHAPAVAVKGRQRVQVDVAVREAEAPAERDSVEPATAARGLTHL